ncbi:two-component system response regulator YesN [Paenibacillus mucilaginosus]|uniref:helix-turn-helix domain-containing protein n=1 Tax=Paenibacillus mucilaginosus TaxID=61624 RepID=UPI003D25A533
MKILIVDDEVIIRTGLAKVIKWKELGLELLKPAASAEEALQRLPEERPHILMTDIRMKKMNGLQLAEKAKEMLPELETVILSGYDDFAYMRQAIRQDVSDYLLKTSGPEEIIKTVLQVKQRIEDKWKSRNEDDYKNREIRGRLFEQWIMEGETAAADPRLLPYYLPHLFGAGEAAEGGMQVFVLTAEGWGASPSASSLLLFAVHNMLNELLQGETLIFKQRIILALRRERRDPSPMDSLLPVVQKIERLLKCSVCVAAGRSGRRPEDLHASYLTAQYAMGYKTLLDQPLIDYAQISGRRGGRTVCTLEEEKELSAILLEEDSVGLNGWVQRYLQPELEDPQATVESIEALIRSAALSAHRWLERVLAATGQNGTAADQVQPLVLPAGHGLKDALFQHLLSVMELYHHHLAGGRAAHTRRAMAYIREHLGGDVSLQQVARHVHLHPSHLSEVFKKEAGMTFGDYVTRQKIERAKELLTVSPAKVAEIAGAVGFEDIKYFSQVFKKFTGRTPSEFREDAAARHAAPSSPIDMHIS